MKSLAHLHKQDAEWKRFVETFVTKIHRGCCPEVEDCWEPTVVGFLNISETEGVAVATLALWRARPRAAPPSVSAADLERYVASLLGRTPEAGCSMIPCCRLGPEPR
jgi:hypothetical protein